MEAIALARRSAHRPSPGEPGDGLHGSLGDRVGVGAGSGQGAGVDDEVLVADRAAREPGLRVLRAQAETDAGLPAPEGWLVGAGAALAMIATGPPGGHIADAKATLLPDGTYDLAVGTAEFGNGTTTVHKQFVTERTGDAGRMAEDVYQALKDIVATHGHMDTDEAAACVRHLSADKRYARDVC